MIFFAAFGIAASLLGYSCFTLRIANFRSMMVSHFITYYLVGLGACYFLDISDKLNALVGIIGLVGAGGWYCIVKLFQRVEEKFGRNEAPAPQSTTNVNGS